MEIWRTIEGHPDYEVSNKGRVRDKRTGTLLQQREHSTCGGYRVYFDGQRHYVHRLVAKAFLDVDGTEYIRHKNDDARDNHISNLEPITDETSYKKRKVNTRVIPCKHCRHRYEYDFCYDRPDDFYCADGEL